MVQDEAKLMESGGKGGEGESHGTHGGERKEMRKWMEE